MATLRTLRAWAIALTMMAATLMAAAPSGADQWNTTRALTVSGSQTHCATSSTGALVAAVWKSAAIQVSTSRDAGQTWSAPASVSEPGEVFAPKVVVADRTIVVVWADMSGPGGIRAATSLDAGATWSAPVHVSDQATDFNPQVALSGDGSRLVAVWRHDDGHEHYFVRAASSNDSGRTWSSPSELSGSDFSSGTARVALADDGKRVIVAWPFYGGPSRTVQVAVSPNGGATWSAGNPVSNPVRSAYNPSLAMSADGTRATLLWQGDTMIEAVRTDVGGDTWSPPQQVSPDGERGEYPAVSVSSSGSQVVAVWNRNLDPGYDVRAVTSDNGGATWTIGPILTSQTPDRSSGGAILSGDGLRARGIWLSQVGSQSILQTALSLDSGVTWPATEYLAQTPDAIDSAVLAVSDDGRYATTTWAANGLVSARSFFPTPALTSVSPDTGDTGGGTALLLAGSGFQGASAVSIGGVPVDFVADSDGRISTRTPAGPAGAVDVVVSGPGGTSTLPAAFTYLAPPKPKPRTRAKTTVRGWPKKAKARKGKIRLTVRVKPAQNRKGIVQWKAKAHWKRYHRYTWKSPKRKVTLRAKKGTVVRYRLKLPATDTAKAKTTRVAEVKGT